MDFQKLYESIASVKNIKAAIEIVDYCINNLPKTKENMILKQKIMAELFNSYEYNKEFSANSTIKKYKIKQLPNKKFEYKMDKKIHSYTITSNTINTINDNEHIFLKIESTKNAIFAAVKNCRNTLAEELIKDLLKNIDLDLSIFSSGNYPKYNESIGIISNVVFLLEPETQIHIFQILKKHFQQDFSSLLKFSNVLLLKGDFDEIIELLESKLPGIDNQPKQDIGSYYYNLGLAHYSKENYQEAKKYYLNASKYLPSDDQGLILELYRIYSITNEVQNAKNALNNLSSKDVKNLLEMSFELSTVSTEKLKLINKKAIPPKIYSLIPELEYIAKFNENKFSENEKFAAFEKLYNSHIDFNNTGLLVIAIYTKQYDAASKILQTFSTEIIAQNKNFYRFKALLEKISEKKFTQIIIDQNNLQGAEAAEIINIANTALIAKGEFTSIPEKVENALQYDANNEETLEIGVAAALLNNNTEKAKEYFAQLSEEKQQEIAANYSKDDNAENIEELVEQYDPKEIHAQYQRIKQQKLFEISQKIINNQNIGGWTISEQKMMLLL